MSSGQRRSGHAWLLALCAIFFLSGASALTYQLLWLRMLGLIFGVTVYAASTVWASFMAGLAIGSVWTGRLADRVRRPLLTFADVFPDATTWDHGTLLAGTKRPFRISPDAFNWKLHSRADGRSRRDGIRSFDDLVGEYWVGPAELRRYVGEGPLLTDDRPTLEYFLTIPRDKDANLATIKGDVSQIIER